MLTGYKIYPTRILESIDVKTHGFETDHELTSKVVMLSPSRSMAPSGSSHIIGVKVAVS